MLHRVPLFILVFVCSETIGQNISATFTASGAVNQIDSITATNLRTNQRVTFPGNETLVLTMNTGIPSASGLTGKGSAFPNPFSVSTTFRMTLQNPQTVNLRILNLMGQVLAENETFVQPGENEFEISANKAGIYMFSVKTEQGTNGYKIICTETLGTGDQIRYLGIGSGNTPQLQLKTSQTGYSLGYSAGEIVYYKCFSGMYTTIMTDSPVNSKNYEVGFAACTDADEKNYSVVKIGSQTWMAENLAYLPAVSPSADGSDISSNLYVFGYQGRSVAEAKNNPNFKLYGVLYNWNAAKIACPDGWQLPDDEECTQLTEYLTNHGYGFGGSGDDVAKSLASNSGWDIFADAGYIGNDPSGNNSSGFTALPGGNRYESGAFGDLGRSTFFWSATGYEYASIPLGWYRNLSFSNDRPYRDSDTRKRGFSVRCLKVDTTNFTTPSASFTVSPPSGTTSDNFQFDASGCTDDETISSNLEVRWDWEGDGTWDTGFNKTKIILHQFLSPGLYPVILEVKDGGGLVDTETKNVAVTGFGTMTDTRDGRNYKTVLIGKQYWMAENLGYVPSVSPCSSAGSPTLSKFYVYDYQGSNVNDAKATENYATYGVLYNWEAAKTACPTGWHLPSDEEWSALTHFLGASAGGQLKETGTIHWYGPNTGATNSTGFTAVPGGGRNSEGSLVDIRGYTYIWSSTGYGSSFVWGRALGFNIDVVNRLYMDRSAGISVRCLKDQ